MKSIKLSYQSLWRSLLTLYEPREAQSIVRLLLDERFGLSLTDIVSDGVEKLDDIQTADLLSMMKRLESGEPVQYVLGDAWFRGRKFYAAKGVLIPRPETEQLCQFIINFGNHNSQLSTLNSQRILDVGTGSGCIATTLALDVTDTEVSAIDISDDALLIARNNADRLGAKVSFYKDDILQPSHHFDGMTFDVIVSNPPYVKESEKAAMSNNVLDYEPSLALFVPDNDPLRFYRAIARFAQEHLRAGGKLYFEINPLCSQELITMLTTMQYADVEIVKDEFNKERFAICSKSNQ